MSPSASRSPGEKELLGLWVSTTEDAEFWLTVFTKLKQRGVTDCFMACVDGLIGLPEALESIFPHTHVQLCIVHKVRQALRYVVWKERRAVARDLRAIYSASTLKEAEAALEQVAQTWDAKYPTISTSWRRDWDRLTVLFDYLPEIRKVIYTTNAIESLNFSLRKILKKRGAFPTDEAILKVLDPAVSLQSSSGDDGFRPYCSPTGGHASSGSSTPYNSETRGLIMALTSAMINCRMASWF